MLISLALCLVLCMDVLAARTGPSHKAIFRGNRGSNSSTDIAQYLQAHNVVREEYRVPPLQWSDSLGKLAQAWAKNCQFRHSNGTLSNAPYGENMVAATGLFPILTALELFSSDAGAYNPASPTFSHFTQVVWRSTKELGCAHSKCPGVFNSTHGLATMYVCLYEPPGNVIGQEKGNVPI